MHELGLLEASIDAAVKMPEIVTLSSQKDVESLHALFEGVGFHKPKDYYHRSFVEVNEGKRLIFAAKLDGRVVGYCMLNWKPKYHFFRKFGIPEVQDLNVIPIARRKGVATALINYCENLVRTRGHEQIGIGVGLLSDYGPAQRLYASMGYIPDGCGVTYDRQPVMHSEIRPFDDDLCLMMVKDL
jgi:GNAT superfamily N-acetyltransferase